jgi:hypothetical protein
LQKELSLKKKKVREDLDRLPESFADNPQAKFLLLCGVFNTEIDKYTTAKSDRTSFFHGLQEEFLKLEKEIMGTRSKFEIVSPLEESKGAELPPCMPTVSSSTEGVHSDKKEKGEKSLQSKNFLE